MPHKLLTNGPSRGSCPKIYTDIYKPKTLQINVKHTTTDTRLPPLKSQRFTGQLLADKVIPRRLKLQELFFLFPKRSCSCFARELGGREDFSTCIHGASASANKVFPEEGGTGRRLRARTTTSATSTQKPHTK